MTTTHTRTNTRARVRTHTHAHAHRGHKSRGNLTVAYAKIKTSRQGCAARTERTVEKFTWHERSFCQIVSVRSGESCGGRGRLRGTAIPVTVGQGVAANAKPDFARRHRCAIRASIYRLNRVEDTPEIPAHARVYNIYVALLVKVDDRSKSTTTIIRIQRSIFFFFFLEESTEVRLVVDDNFHDKKKKYYDSEIKNNHQIDQIIAGCFSGYVSQKLAVDRLFSTSVKSLNYGLNVGIMKNGRYPLRYHTISRRNDLVFH